jgi:DNA end-binding protein Ku
MAGRSIWKGVIHFKETDIPVKLHTAVKEQRVHFHLLHRPDQARLQQQMICALEKVPVPREEQTKGFEVEESKYILIDSGELEKLEPESSRIIEVHEFVHNRQIAPLFLDRMYYLESDSALKGGYHALAAALSELQVAGICTWTMRKRSYFGALQAGDNILRLVTLRYADELIPIGSLDLQNFFLSEKELKVGGDLINQLTVPFEPQKFENDHELKLQNLIEQKARGEKIKILRPKPRKPTSPDNLLETLEASLKKVA